MNAAELILNPDGSVYHLNLLPEDIAPTIILVGDQDRVPMVSQHFDRMDCQKQKREFVTHTGWIGQQRISVLSTGIGTDNIDIVLNELDALVNIDFATRHIKSTPTSLQLIRIGSSGSIHPDIHVDEVVVSGMAIGTDVLGSYYQSEKLIHKLLPTWSYLTRRFAFDLNSFQSPFTEGITITAPGFYGPQGRILRMTPVYTIPLDELHLVNIHGLHITNLEMETAGIYLLAEQLGHKAVSFNAILAQRQMGLFSQQPAKTISTLIQDVLAWIAIR